MRHPVTYPSQVLFARVDASPAARRCLPDPGLVSSFPTLLKAIIKHTFMYITLSNTHNSKYSNVKRVFLPGHLFL